MRLQGFEDIKNLTEKSPQERNAFVRQHARSVSGTSQRASSISSDGMVDEEDEEPFSAAGVETQPKQDVLSKRPNPSLRGRFPSDIDTNASRSLQAPLSPSSGSSAGFGDAPTRDHGPIVGERYGVDAASPTHAAIINQYAKEDGVNPYTHEPIQNSNRADAGVAAAGLAATGVVGIEAYRKGKEAEAANTPDNFAQRQQDRAAYEVCSSFLKIAVGGPKFKGYFLIFLILIFFYFFCRLLLSLHQTPMNNNMNNWQHEKQRRSLLPTQISFLMRS